jgi:FKBP-type peptidyl-prolyl cis-trans isomerase
MSPMPKLLLIIPACVALLLVGCGSDSSSTSSGGEEASTAAGKTEESAAAKEEGNAAAKKGEEAATKKAKPKVEVPKGPPPEKLVIKDLEEGSGPEAKPGDEVTVQYVGVNYKTGKQFDASWDRGKPFTFALGEALVVEGWEKGIPGMKPGGRRELIIPPELGYGYNRIEGIPPGSTLVFVVDLLKVA